MEHGVTLFIPLYNEEAVLKSNIVRLMLFMENLSLPCPYEIILGSNGSTDRTPAIGRSLAANADPIVFSHITRRGPGLAFAEALEQVAYDRLICLDADLSTHLDFIPRALAALSDHDAVVGSKQTGDQKRPLVRILASELFIACSNLLLRMPFRDYSIGAKAYRTVTIRGYRHRIDRHTFYTQELLHQLMKTGKSIIEIPVTCRDLRPSRFNLMHEGVYRNLMLLRLWFRCLGEKKG